jgi:hypothetical protein
MYSPCRNASTSNAIAATIGSHFARQATPEVWAEVDELRALLEATERALRIQPIF